MMRHPYLFFSAADAEAYFSEKKKSPEWAGYYSSLCGETEKVLAEELVDEEAAKGNSQNQHANYGVLSSQADRFFSTLGIKYLIDGDARCAEKIKELLLHLITFDRWHSGSYLKRTPAAWHSDLLSTRTALATAKLYDLIFAYLTDDERRKISAGILEKGVYTGLGDWVLPGKRIHALDSMGHNWWAVCAGESAMAYLCVSDFVPDEERDRVISLVDGAMAGYLTYKGNSLFNKIRSFDEKGLFYEGSGYSCYGTGTLLRYLNCRERYYGRCEVIRAALPEDFSDSFMTMSYPYTDNGKTKYGFVNFGDCAFNVSYEGLLETAVCAGIDTSALRALAAGIKPDTQGELRGYHPDRLNGDISYLPKTAVFPSGIAIARDSWEPDSTLFAVKCGACWNHSHNDSGSFVIFHKGRPFFIDSGSCNYDSPLYHAYYCQDSAHSTVLVGGEGRRFEELYRGTKFPAVITDSFSGDGVFFVQADSTGPMAHLTSRLFRNFFWFDNRLLVIFDDIFAHEENTAQFTLHYDGGYKSADGALLFENGASRAKLISHFPEDTAVSEGTGHPDHEEDKDKPYIIISTKEKLRTHLLVHTLELDHDEHAAVYEKLRGKEADGLRISEDDTEREIWFNHYADGHIMHDNANTDIAGYETDAYMLVITRDKRRGTEKAFVVCGSYLRRDGRSFLESFTKKTAEVITVC